MDLVKLDLIEFILINSLMNLIPEAEAWVCGLCQKIRDRHLGSGAKLDERNNFVNH